MSLTSSAEPAPKRPGEPASEHLTADEIIAALDALTSDDKLRLHLIERGYLSGTDFKPGDLVHEAMSRAIVGLRRCPRDVALMAFLAQTMRSVTHHERKRRAALRRAEKALKPGQRDDRTPSEGKSDDLSPEDHLLEKEARDLIQAMHSHFVGDEQAQLVLMGWADGLRGHDLRSTTGLDQAALDYAIKRIRRRLKKLYPNGWAP